MTTLENSTVGLQEFMKANLNGDFRPIAYYDKHLDCIRVQIVDGSFTEHRMNRFLTILKKNHIESTAPAGFNIKGVRYLFEELKLDPTRVHKLTSIIDCMVKVYPDAAIKKIKSMFSAILQDENLEVNLAIA